MPLGLGVGSHGLHSADSGPLVTVDTEMSSDNEFSRSPPAYASSEESDSHSRPSKNQVDSAISLAIEAGNAAGSVMQTLAPMIQRVRSSVDSLGLRLDQLGQENASNMQTLHALEQRAECNESSLETLHGYAFAEFSELKAAISGLGQASALSDDSLLA